MARGSREPWAPTGRALIAAAVLHALGLVALRQAASHLDAAIPPPDDPVEAVQAVEVELDLTASPPPEMARTAGVDAPVTVEGAASRVATRRLAVEPPHPEEPTPDVVVDEPSTPAPVAGEEAWGGPPGVDGDLPLPSLAGDPLWMSLGGLETVAPPAPTRVTPRPVDRQAATRAIAGTMQARDRELGRDVPAAGDVASALATSVRGTPAPHGARATFEVRLGADGNLLSARWMGASKGDPRDWESAAAEAKKALAGRALPMGDAGALRGALIRVHVTTVHQLPSGLHHVEVHARCANALLNDLITANRKSDESDANEAAPDVTIFTDERGNPCLPIGLGMQFDPADIGAHRVLQVRTSVEVVIPGVASLPSETPDVDTGAPWGGREIRGPRPNAPFVERKWKKKADRVAPE
jgi:hypothetical protein